MTPELIGVELQQLPDVCMHLLSAFLPSCWLPATDGSVGRRINNNDIPYLVFSAGHCLMYSSSGSPASTLCLALIDNIEIRNLFKRIPSMQCVPP
jgi:hypothetical protein